MTDASIARRSPIDRAGLDRDRVDAMLADALHGADDGELFLEERQTEQLVFEDGTLKQAGLDAAAGFGLRAVAGEAAGHAHSSEISEAALRRAIDTVRAATRGYSGFAAISPRPTNARLYDDHNPLSSPAFGEKVEILRAVDAYLRAKDLRVVQASAALSGSWQSIEILRPGQPPVRDARPLVRLVISVVVEVDGRREIGSYGMGGRAGYEDWIGPERWRRAADEALRRALVNLEAVPAPAGELDVVLGPGWPGVMLHEAVGHGLEGDFTRKGTSAFAGLVGQRVASEAVTVVDDGTLPGRRGSITVDDEGTPSSCTVLIENGMLVGYMQDRQNARLARAKPTGNGRRQSCAHPVLPRMTNTYMLAGAHTPEEIIASIGSGLYAVSFGGGQVDITSGKFVFHCTEAYRIENGRVGQPVKGAMLIGNGPDALTRVRMVGNDLALDDGQGTCGKAGQWVPVSVGQPTLRIDRMTVGGTG